MKGYDGKDPEKYETRHETIPREGYLHDYWHPLIKSMIRKFCTDEMTLDLGCGGGAYTTAISEYTDHVLGIDISNTMLRYAKNKNNKLSYAMADAQHIPLKSESIDAVVCIGLFEYIERPIVLREINRVLKPDGICIIQCPNKYSAVRIPDKAICKIVKRKYQAKEPSYGEMFKLFKQYDFELLESRMDDGLIWLPNFLDWLIGREVYPIVENFTRIFGRNPFSNIMLFAIRKVK